MLLQRLQFAIPQILAVLLPIFCPLMIVARLSVDRLLRNIADGKGGDLPLQFLNLFFHTAPPFRSIYYTPFSLYIQGVIRGYIVVSSAAQSNFCAALL